jgi:hypothetical protein
MSSFVKSLNENLVNTSDFQAMTLNHLFVLSTLSTTNPLFKLKGR